MSTSQIAECSILDERLARRALWIPVVTISPFVILLVCGFPHLDDFCAFAPWLDRGLIGMLRDTYVTWSGRLFSNAARPYPS
jgi:hypothetical protein